MNQFVMAKRGQGARALGGILLGALISLGTLASALAVEAPNEGQKVHYDIPAQPLSSALKALADTADVQVVYAADAVGDTQVPALRGNYTAQEALQLLLRDTHLTYVNNGKDTIVIKRDSAAPIARNQGDASWRVAQGESAKSDDERSGTKESTDGVTLEEITVTATRLDRRRNDVPTPLFTIDANALRETGYPNPIAALNELPQFKATATPNSLRTTQYPGTWGLDLRGLGMQRTLTLIDGRRFVSEYLLPDAAVVPQILIDHVDVVTGSASAAWGSNAIAGVVNMVLDNKLEGLRFNAQYGASDRGDGRQPHYEAAVGKFFSDHKGHLLLGAEFSDAQANDEELSRDLAAEHSTRGDTFLGGLTLNPACTPSCPSGQRPLARVGGAFLGVVNQPNVNFSRGGYVMSGVNTGQTFNSDGSLRPFDFGTPLGGIFVNPEGHATGILTSPYRKYSGFGRVSYDLTDSLKITVDLLHTRVWDNKYPWFAWTTADSISADNAFLSPVIRNQMSAAGEATFTLGRLLGGVDNQGWAFDSRTTQATLALDGSIGEQWRWSGYYGRGDYSNGLEAPNSLLSANYAKAIDSVVSPVTGQPVCRVNVDADPANDDPSCIPYNPFGEGVSSAAARSYVYGTSWERESQTLDTAGLTFRGEPMSVPAGKVSLAVGAEWRRETADMKVDPGSAANGWTFVNWAPYAPGAENTTKEGFAEILIPLVKDIPLLNRLNFNGAARYIDDKTASLWAWKLGFTDQVMQSLQLRFTTSRDIRAPNLYELYYGQQTGFVSVFDPKTGSTIFTRGTSGGNPALVPETSRTTTVGATIEPQGIPHLRFSADYFDIDIENAISTVEAQQVVDLCSLGVTAACNAIVRDSTGQISLIASSQLNFVKIQFKGVDAAAEYALPTSSGTWKLRGMLTWMLKSQTDNGLAKLDYLGNNGQSYIGFGNVRLSGNVSLSYERERFQGHMTGRYISSGLWDKQLDSQIQNNQIPAYTYVDVGATIRLPSIWGEFPSEIFANVNNILDKGVPTATSASSYYDCIGRYYVLGGRIRF